MALPTSLPRKPSAVSFIFVRIIAEISSGENCFLAPFTSASICGLPFASLIAKLKWDASSLTDSSANFLPMSRLAS